MDILADYLASSRNAREQQLAAYLRFPSISSDPNCREALQECARFSAQLLQEAGLQEVTVWQTPGNPIVTASWRQAPGRPTVLIYGHYDVQPVDPLSLWISPPFAPRWQNERIFARGATDDKGQLLMHIQAVAALLHSNGSLPVNIIFLLEGEEEIGSPNLPAFLEAHRQELAADLAIVSDSSMWAEQHPAITTSLRGLVLLEVTLSGPNRDLHSGTYGGAVANPLEMLARLLASLKSDEGTVTIPGFYEHVLPVDATIRKQWQNLPFDENKYLETLGIDSTWGEAGYSLLERIWSRPTLEINGLWGGYNGPGGKTVLPATAHAKLSMRLVANQDPETMAELLQRHLLAITPSCVRIEVQRIAGGGHPVTIPLQWPPMQTARRVLEESFGHETLLVGEGASIPVVADFAKLLGVHTLLIGFGLPDANTHSPNESLHLPTFHTGIASLMALFKAL
ncbi:dipeptidase [Candidatus Magnetaquicoccus inordinatus]|uniref:dipeptidase n=1 Tax=Candidatus Magnetaquicoccus inordinatus TaxID=2496818 RepID=UPI00102C23CB|nr:dipeptidase [Candidatus Magnetaquicoccus inordinatus]